MLDVTDLFAAERFTYADEAVALLLTRMLRHFPFGDPCSVELGTALIAKRDPRETPIEHSSPLSNHEVIKLRDNLWRRRLES